MRRFSKGGSLWFLALALAVGITMSGCSALNSLMYRADIKGETASISFNRLNGTKEEKITLSDSRLMANVEASTQDGLLLIILKFEDGTPLAGFVVRGKESTKVEQLGPFPKGTYTLEVRGEQARSGSIKVSFTS